MSATIWWRSGTAHAAWHRPVLRTAGKPHGPVLGKRQDVKFVRPGHADGRGAAQTGVTPEALTTAAVAAQGGATFAAVPGDPSARDAASSRRIDRKICRGDRTSTGLPRSPAQPPTRARRPPPCYLRAPSPHGCSRRASARRSTCTLCSNFENCGLGVRTTTGHTDIPLHGPQRTTPSAPHIDDRLRPEHVALRSPARGIGGVRRRSTSTRPAGPEPAPAPAPPRDATMVPPRAQAPAALAPRPCLRQRWRRPSVL